MAKILIAEDDQTSRCRLRETLEDWGHYVVPTSDGIEALEKAENEEFDLIVIDWMMPRLDGIELCEKLKGTGKTQDIPLVMLSTKKSPDDIAKAYDVGFDDYVTKPFNREDFKTRISRHFKK